MASTITDIMADANQALLDMAEYSGVSVWAVIGGIAIAAVVLIIVVVWLIMRRRKASAMVYTEDGSLEFVEETVAEFPADKVRIEGKKGKIVIKLISPAPQAGEESLPPQEVKGEPLPSKVEEPKPPVSKKAAEEKAEPESKPIAMGAVGQPPKKPEPKKEETK